jgi:putative component of toxin-antitoxin plasmid stabilization module
VLVQCAPPCAADVVPVLGGLYELRVGLRGQNYRMLYFFHGAVAAVLTHGLIKEDRLPPKDIERAIRRKQTFEQDPRRHTYQAEL